jgi:CheY-like chemotaxis protein
MTQNARILIIDDNAGDAKLAIAGLREIGFGGSIEHVENGHIGIGKIRNYERTDGAYDIAILDVNMPHITGCGILHVLRKTGTLENLFIAILTTACCGLRGTGKSVGCTDHPANIYLEKKMQYDDLVEELGRLRQEYEIFREERKQVTTQA